MGGPVDSEDSADSADRAGLGAFVVGTVTEFDEHVGLGRVANDEGAWAFHCTEITDGTRAIEPTTTVTFRVGPGGPGRWEAFELRSLGLR